MPHHTEPHPTEPRHTGIVVLYEDPHLIAVDKPAGLLCVPGLSEPDNLHDLVKKSHPQARVIHRLDMATSGLVLFALNHAAQRGMGKLFENRQISKCYDAVVDGKVDATLGEIHCPILCDWPNRPKQKVAWLDGKHGITYFETISHDPVKNCSRLRLKPYSGRTHQLRVHTWNLGHPILGDRFYHNDNSHLKSARLMLHAAQLDFVHPITETKITIAANAPF